MRKVKTRSESCAKRGLEKQDCPLWPACTHFEDKETSYFLTFPRCGQLAQIEASIRFWLGTIRGSWLCPELGVDGSRPRTPVPPYRETEKPRVRRAATSAGPKEQSRSAPTSPNNPGERAPRSLDRVAAFVQRLCPKNRHSCWEQRLQAREWSSCAW